MLASLAVALSGCLPTPSLRDLANRKGLAFGTAVRESALSTDSPYSSTVASQFNLVVPENELKWDALEPQQGTFDFSQGDAIVNFAAANGIAVKGTPLVWDSQNPAWLTNGTFTRDQLIAILQTYITTVVGHYKGKVAQWDVVNEAVADDGTLRNDVWLQAIGPDYIDMAFEFAHEADPNAKLFYNDYGGEGLGTKSDAIYNLVAGLKQRGVPIDGVGLQMHIDASGSPSPADVASNMSRLNALGLQTAITEMDVRLPLPATNSELASQASVYQSMLRDCLTAANCGTFVMWGFTDKYSWIPGFLPGYGAATMLDDSFNAKPAYYAIRQDLGG